MFNLTSYIRIENWWSYKTTTILGFIYFYCNYLNIPTNQLFAVVFFFIISFIGLAGLGYVINDSYDMEVDRKAKKVNRLDGKSLSFKVKLFFILSLLAFLPWFYLRLPWYISICLLSLLFLLFTYSHPYTRYKEHPVLGPISDALYGNVLPVLITCFTFQQYLVYIPYDEAVFYGSLIIWQFLNGLRNIFSHQLNDYENDIHSGTQTLVTIRGKVEIYRKTMIWVLPLEIIFLMIFLMSIGPTFESIWLFLLFFIFVYRFGHGIFKNLKWDQEDHRKNTYLYILNDFYEMYLPYYFLLSFCFLKPEYVLFLIVHILMFPLILKRIKSDIFLSIIEFKNYVKDSIYPIYRYFIKKK